MTTEPHLVWIGLGKLGLPMAARVAAAGHELLGCDLDPDRIEAARQRQVSVAERPAQAVRAAAAVLTSLPDDRSFEAALCGDGGLIAGMERGAILADTSTVSPEISARVAATAEARGIAYLRVPVSGNPVLAERGELTVLASGPRDAFERLRPVLAAISTTQHYLGEAEQARYAKLSINLMIAVSAGMMAEAMALARKGGVETGQMLDLMVDSAIGSPMVKYKAPPLKAGDYTSTFSCRQMAKDLDLILGAARATDVPAPLAAQQREAYSALIASGDGDADFIATVRYAARLAGFHDAESATGDQA